MPWISCFWLNILHYKSNLVHNYCVGLKRLAEADQNWLQNFGLPKHEQPEEDLQ